MKHKCNYLIGLLALLFLLSSCEEPFDKDGSDGLKVQSVSLGIDTSSISISRSKTIQLNVTINPSNEELQGFKWINSDPTIVSVSETGLVTALQEGEAIVGIETNIGKKRALLGIIVTKYITDVPITSIVLNKTSHDFTAITDDALQLTTTITPTNPTLGELKWVSSNTSVASVSANGLVSIIGGGSALIKALAIDGGDAFAECAITVPGTAIKDLNYDSIGTIYSTGYYKIVYEPIEIEVKDFISGKTEKQIWLDRNLGARQRATAYNDYLSFGSLFQWSRKADGHEQVTWNIENDKIKPTFTPVQVEQVKNRADAGTINFITPGSKDWADDPSTASTGLWGGKQFKITSNLSSSAIDLNHMSTIGWHASLDDETQANNPCPKGYRIPSVYEWHQLVASIAGMESIIFNGANTVPNATTVFAESPLFIPFAGNRACSKGDAANQSVWVMFWTNSTLSGTHGWPLRIQNKGLSRVYQQQKTNGYSVRCIKD